MIYQLLILMLMPICLISQSIISEGSGKYKLESIVDVEVFQQKGCAQCYYYLPTNLSLAYKDSEPEISLVKWEAEGDAEAGAILHFLIKWDLSKQQQTNLEHKISTATEEKAVLMGPAAIEYIEPDRFFFGEDDLVKLLNENLNSKPPIATTPGAKMAFSFRFKGDQVDQLLKELKEIKKSDAHINLKYFYQVDNVKRDLNLKLKLKDLFRYI